MHVVLARPAGLAPGMMKSNDSYVILGTIPDADELEDFSNYDLKLRIFQRALQVIMQPLKEANLTLCTMPNVRGLRMTIRPIIAGLPQLPFPTYFSMVIDFCRNFTGWLADHKEGANLLCLKNAPGSTEFPLLRWKARHNELDEIHDDPDEAFGVRNEESVKHAVLAREHSTRHIRRQDQGPDDAVKDAVEECALLNWLGNDAYGTTTVVADFLHVLGVGVIQYLLQHAKQALTKEARCIIIQRLNVWYFHSIVCEIRSLILSTLSLVCFLTFPCFSGHALSLWL